MDNLQCTLRLFLSLIMSLYTSLYNPCHHHLYRTTTITTLIITVPTLTYTSYLCLHHCFTRITTNDSISMQIMSFSLPLCLHIYCLMPLTSPSTPHVYSTDIVDIFTDPILSYSSCYQHCWHCCDTTILYLPMLIPPLYQHHHNYLHRSTTSNVFIIIVPPSNFPCHLCCLRTNNSTTTIRVTSFLYFLLWCHH